MKSKLYRKIRNAVTTIKLLPELSFFNNISLPYSMKILERDRERERERERVII
jgi:hypothetical protein